MGDRKKGARFIIGLTMKNKSDPFSDPFSHIDNYDKTTYKSIYLIIFWNYYWFNFKIII